MQNPTDDDPFRQLAEMAAKDPEVLELLNIVCELKDKHGGSGVELFLELLDELLKCVNILQELPHESTETPGQQQATQPRASSHVAEAAE